VVEISAPYACEVTQCVRYWGKVVSTCLVVQTVSSGMSSRWSVRASGLEGIESAMLTSVSFRKDDSGTAYYLINVQLRPKVIRPGFKPTPDYVVEKRFRQFFDLDQRIRVQFPEISKSLPSLPHRYWKLFVDHKDPAFLGARQRALSFWLEHLVSSVQSSASSQALEMMLVEFLSLDRVELV